MTDAFAIGGVVGELGGSWGGVRGCRRISVKRPTTACTTILTQSAWKSMVIPLRDAAFKSPISSLTRKCDEGQRLAATRGHLRTLKSRFSPSLLSEDWITSSLLVCVYDHSQSCQQLCLCFCLICEAIRYRNLGSIPNCWCTHAPNRNRLVGQWISSSVTPMAKRGGLEGSNGAPLRAVSEALRPICQHLFEPWAGFD